MYFEHWGVATLSTHLLMGNEKRGSGCAGCHAQGAASNSREHHPPSGTDGSGDAPLLSSNLDPTGTHDVLSSTKVVSVHALQDGVFLSSLTTSALHPADLPSCPHQGAGPSPSPSPRAQRVAFRGLRWCLSSLLTQMWPMGLNT